jgi:oligosaccharide repeat unit polymerase
MEDATRHRLKLPAVSLANPAVVYGFVWLLILWLFRLRLTALLLPLNRSTVALVLSSVGIAAALGALVTLFLPRPVPYAPAREARELQQLYRWRYWALTIWAIASLFEIAVARGLPIIWLVIGDSTHDYRNFGIPSIHGTLTALYLFGVATTAVEIFLNGRSRRWLMLLALLIWPVLEVNRGALIWAICQIAGVYLVCRQLRMRMVAGLLAAALAAILLFGIIGDARAGAAREGLRALAGDEGMVLTEHLPSGFLWVYLYTTTPLNNIVRAIDDFEPGGTLYFSVASLLPTVVRQFVFTDVDRKYPLGLVDEAFNTSTWFVAFLADFGKAGALAITGLLQLIAALFYRSARAWRPWAIVGYSACFQAIALSVFADTFTSLVSVAQLGLALALQTMAARTSA